MEGVKSLVSGSAVHTCYTFCSAKDCAIICNFNSHVTRRTKITADTELCIYTYWHQSLYMLLRLYGYIRLLEQAFLNLQGHHRRTSSSSKSRKARAPTCVNTGLVLGQKWRSWKSVFCFHYIIFNRTTASREIIFKMNDNRLYWETEEKYKKNEIRSESHHIMRHCNKSFWS